MKEKLKEIIIKAVPEIVELKFGCRVIIKEKGCVINHLTPYGEWLFSSNYLGRPAFYNLSEYKYKIIGRSITLEDVLVASKFITPKKTLCVDGYGLFSWEYWETSEIDCGKWEEIEGVEWQLNQPLDNQSEQTIEFLYNLLK